MSLDLICTIHTQPLRRITREQTSQDTLRCRANAFAKHKRVLQDLLVHDIGVLIVVRRETGKHLVEEDTQCPPVDDFVVAFSVQNLGSEVLGCTAEGVGLVGVFHVELAETEVAEGDVTSVVQEDILGFQVTKYVC